MSKQTINRGDGLVDAIEWNVKCEDFNKPVSNDEVCEAIRKAKWGKAHGIDEIMKC